MSLTPAPIDLLPKHSLLLDGQWLAGGSGGDMQHIYPATGEPTRHIALAGADEVDRAVRSCRAALPTWRALPGARRRDLLLHFADLLDRDAETLVTLGACENGVPIARGRLHFRGAVEQFRYVAGWADKHAGEVLPAGPMPGFNYVQPEPYGVVALIIPWNAPMHILGATLGPALAVGNAVVLKPSELAPFTSAKVGELLLEAGVPPGVVNIVTAGPAGSEALVRHPGVDKIHFTGSGATARKVLTGALENLTPVGLELGGKSARLVFADADMDVAVREAVSGALAMSGQGCLLGTRILVDEAVYPVFVERCAQVLRSVVVGDPMADTSQIGPVVSRAACERILGTIEMAKACGKARLVCGGARLGGDLAEGYFIQPTLFADVDNATPLARNEIFGPVLSMMPFRTEEEAVRLANDTSYGLAGYIHTNDLKRCHRVAAALEVGNVWVNGFFFGATLPFGGVKQSGFGRTGGRQGLDEFSRVKNVWMPL